MHLHDRTPAMSAEATLAYFEGLRNSGVGVDPEAASALGIPMDPGEAQRQFESGRAVKEVQEHATRGAAPALARSAAHAYYSRAFNLSGTLDPETAAEQRATNTKGLVLARTVLQDARASHSGRAA